MESMAQRQNFWTIFGNGNGVFDMSRRFTVCCHDAPSITKGDDVRTAHGDHGFNTDAHAFFQTWSMSWCTVVWNFRIFMHTDSDAVTYIFTKYSIAIGLHVAFDSVTYVAYGIAYYGLLDASKECTFGGGNQLEVFLVCMSYRNSDTGVTHVTI